MEFSASAIETKTPRLIQMPAVYGTMAPKKPWPVTVFSRLRGAFVAAISSRSVFAVCHHELLNSRGTIYVQVSGRVVSVRYD